MNISSDLPAEASPTSAQVSVQQKATDSQEKAINTVIDSVTSQSPATEGSKGQNLAAYA